LRCLKRLPNNIQRVGLLANTEKASCVPVLQQARKWLLEAGREVLAETGSGQFANLDCPLIPSVAQLGKRCDLLIVFGGDGTMLRAGRELDGASTPIMGINLGGLGFLTAASSDDVIPALSRVLSGDFSIEARPLLKVTYSADKSAKSRAINDVVISRGAVPRLIELDVFVDGEELTRYRCDGLIISSPTGSTAYSLAAGGAIVSPNAEVFTVTPICPHTLSNRSVILNLSSTIVVRAASKKPETIVSTDGETFRSLAEGQEVVIVRSRRSVHLVRLSGTSFFKTLRQKLNWSGSSV